MKTIADKVLLVDDDCVFLNTLSRSLQRRQLDVVAVSDSQQALAQIHQTCFTLILLDLNLDGESGLALLEQILKVQPQARIVLLTAYASITTAVDAIKKGADNYLCKPISSQDILNLLEESERATEYSEAPSYNPMSVNRLEWEHLQRVLHEHQGNISATARALGMHRRTLQRKLAKRPSSR